MKKPDTAVAQLAEEPFNSLGSNSAQKPLGLNLSRKLPRSIRGKKVGHSSKKSKHRVKFESFGGCQRVADYLKHPQTV